MTSLRRCRRADRVYDVQTEPDRSWPGSVLLNDAVDPDPASDASTSPVASVLASDRQPAADVSHRLLRVSERVALGTLVLLTVCAVVSAKYGGSLPVHPLPLAGWGLGAAVSAVALAALAGESGAAAAVGARRRRRLGTVLMVLLLVAATGVVTSADGLAGPAWVVFLPILVVAGAVLGAVPGLLVGAGAACGLYAAAGLSHTLTSAGLGRLVVILPALPALGWAAGGLAAAAHAAAADAHRRREALEADVDTLTELLGRVADGDLSTVPALERPADPATADLAVAFSDTLLALRRLVRQLGGVAERLAASSTELATGATHHVGAVEEQVAAVAETTSTIEQLATTARSIAETAVRVAKCAGRTRLDVDAGAGAVAESTQTMLAIGERIDELNSRTHRLDERVRRIAAAAGHIDELGHQTTMLAVNAAIEAARVDEAGPGFATVAVEIDQLAYRARQATARISGIVAELQAEVDAAAAVNAEGHDAIGDGVRRQRDVEHALHRISEMVDETTQATRDITLATRQQRSASDAVVIAMQQVMSASDRAREATHGHARSAERLRDVASEVRATVARFRVE